MPTDITSVGPMGIPLPSGAANESLHDRTLLGILDYLGFWLRFALSDKTGQQQGPVDSNVIADACPTTNLHPWNHHGTFVRSNAAGDMPLPGLWAWEESQESTAEGASLLYDVIRREIRVQYVFPQLLAPKGVRARAGLIPAVSRVFAKAAERGRHSEYGFDGDDNGTAIWRSCSWRGWDYRGGRAEAVAMVPSAGNSQGARRAEGAEKRFYPSFLATFWVWERIGLEEPSDDDALAPGDLTIAIADDSDDESLDVMERVLPGAS